ncbi:MAG: WD40 repeat domain-containing protein [Alphaproteobacteria bacterium]
MSDTQNSIPSVADRVNPVAAGAPVVAVHFTKDRAAFVLGEETVLFVAADGSEQRVAVHAGGILSAVADGRRIVTGGDDGSVVAIDAQGKAETLATDPKHRWIDRVALGPDGAVAWSAGKQAFVRSGKGEVKSLELPSSAGGLAFSPKGLRVAIAHYGGVTLWFPNAVAAPETFAWKGSHLDVTFSPDGRFLVTAMQEPMLHGWRLADAKDMRMSGYSAKVRSCAWTAGGKWLATSGSEQLIMWPFQSKDGPMGKQPRMLAPYSKRAVAVACHPKQEIVAVGFEDGLIMLCRMEDGAEILAKKPGSAPVSVLAWSADGARLAFGTEDGEAGIADLA